MNYDKMQKYFYLSLKLTLHIDT